MCVDLVHQAAAQAHNDAAAKVAGVVADFVGTHAEGGLSMVEQRSIFSGKHVHLMGVGGAGMSALVPLATRGGYGVRLRSW